MARTFAKIIGWVFLIVGIMGFFVENLFGLIHFDPMHNLVHLVIGIWGIWASGKEAASLSFAKIIGIIYMIIGIIGFIVPGWLGFLHLEMSENLIHLIVGAIALYIGYVTGGPEGSKTTTSA